MRQREAVAGLEAQGFNSVREDEALHANLARANLMRLRGDFAEAEKVCVSLLAAYPDNAAVHTLLGDIAFSQDQAGKAIEHYEIAQQLDDKAPDIPRKLAEARRLHESHETSTTAEQLGLPTKPPLPWTSIGFGVIAALALGGALIAGLAASPRGANETRGTAAAIVAGPDAVATGGAATSKEPSATPEGEPKPTDVQPTPSPVQPSAPPVVSNTLDDQTLLTQIQSHGTIGSHLMALTSDPRTHGVTLTYSVGPEEDARHIGAELAKSTLDLSGDTLAVTVRAVRDQKLAYMADVSRTLYADTITEAWQKANPDPDAWLNHAITNEWPIRTSESMSKTP